MVWVHSLFDAIRSCWLPQICPPVSILKCRWVQAWRPRNQTGWAPGLNLTIQMSQSIVPATQQFHQDSLTKEWILELSPGNAGPSSEAKQLFRLSVCYITEKSKNGCMFYMDQWNARLSNTSISKHTSGWEISIFRWPGDKSPRGATIFKHLDYLWFPSAGHKVLCLPHNTTRQTESSQSEVPAYCKCHAKRAVFTCTPKKPDTLIIFDFLQPVTKYCAFTSSSISVDTSLKYLATATSIWRSVSATGAP